MYKPSTRMIAAVPLVACMATAGMGLARAAGDPVRQDVVFMLRQARSNFAGMRGALAGSDDKTRGYALNPHASLMGLACDAGSGCGVSDYFAENGNPEYWEAAITVAQPAWAAPDYAGYRANIIRVLGPLVPGYTVQESPPYLAGGQGIFSVTLANRYEALTIHGFIGGGEPASNTLDIDLDHLAVGKTVHTYVRPKPLDGTRLHALGSAFEVYALKAIRHASDDFAGYHPALADRRYGKSYYNIPFTSSPYISSCDIDFNQGVNQDLNQYGPAAAQGWSIACSSGSYENTPGELTAAVVSAIEVGLPPGFNRTSASGSSIEWKNPQSDIKVLVGALKNRPSDTHPHRSRVVVSVYHSDGPPH